MLDIRNLSKTYPNGIQALVDVSLEIPRGLFGLLGPNGAGKSTLMRTLATLQEADAGSATLEQLDVLREKAAVRRLLGYLPQEFGVYPKISAEAMLEHLAVLKGLTDRAKRKAAVSGLLELTNLWSTRKQRLDTFSGGMRQRFGIAQALLAEPRLIIVDEPTAGLDPEERHRFLNILSEIGDTIVVILSTHIVEDVREVCSRMAIIDQGRLLLSGSPPELMAALEGRLWEKEVDKQEAETLKHSLSVLSSRHLAGRCVLRVHSDTRPDEGFEPTRPDLQDVYFLALKLGPDGSPEDSRGAGDHARGSSTTL